MTEIIKRKWRDGKVVSETKEQIDWQPNESDMDQVLVHCTECGNRFHFPRDACMFLHESYCGQCGGKGTLEVIE